MAKTRLDPSVFDLPIHELRHGYRSDIYFNRSKIILENDNHNPAILMQAFQKNSAILCGVDEAVAIIKYGSGFYKERDKAYELFSKLINLKNEIRTIYHSDKKAYLKKKDEKNKLQEALDEMWESSSHKIKIEALYDGDSVAPFESVINIEGNASFFIHLETLYLGALARRTRVATNVRRVVEAASGKHVLFFPARFDHYANQEGDGYAAKIGGATLVSTDAQGALWGASGAGTIPHSLIACYGGDTTKSALKFATTFEEVNCIALVDWENDCVKTSVEVARKLKDKLYAVRLDTSDTMVDKSVQTMMAQFNPTGVCPELVNNVRMALDKEGFNHVKIIVSGGFNVSKIRYFEESGSPVDAYGVGSSLFTGHFDYTADVVKVNGKDLAKSGRFYRPNKRLKNVE